MRGAARTLRQDVDGQQYGAKLEAVGVACVALGKVDRSVDHAAGHTYFGVWSAPPTRPTGGPWSSA